MNSRLYNCSIAHHRRKPKPHAFAYRIFMAYLDLEEIDALCACIPLLGHNRFAPFEYRDTDHYQRDQLSNAASIKLFLSENGIHQAVGRIQILTHLRTWGHVFNPVSFYFVFDEQDQPLCHIAEVDNTFNEQKLYLLPIGQEVERTKNFYVSPFSDLDTTFHFKLAAPKQQLRLVINQSKGGETYFRSALTGQSQALTNASLALSAIRFPLLTVRILFAIHWHALLLYAKGIPLRRKAANPHLQTETRPYLSQAKHPIH